MIPRNAGVVMVAVFGGFCAWHWLKRKRRTHDPLLEPGEKAYLEVCRTSQPPGALRLGLHCTLHGIAVEEAHQSLQRAMNHLTPLIFALQLEFVRDGEDVQHNAKSRPIQVTRLEGETRDVGEVWKDLKSAPVRTGDRLIGCFLWASGQSVTLILACEHCITDGGGGIMFFNNLLAEAFDYPQGCGLTEPVPFGPSMEEACSKRLLAEGGGWLSLPPTLKAYWVFLRTWLANRVGTPGAVPPQLADSEDPSAHQDTYSRLLVISPEKSLALLYKCKENGCTLTTYLAGLMSKLIVDVLKISPCQGGLNCNLRALYLQEDVIPNTLRLHTSGLLGLTVTQVENVWGLARRWHRTNRQQVNAGVPLIMGRDMSGPSMIRTHRREQTQPYTFVITSVGVLPVRPLYGDKVRVQNFYALGALHTASSAPIVVACYSFEQKIHIGLGLRPGIDPNCAYVLVDEIEKAIDREV